MKKTHFPSTAAISCQSSSAGVGSWNSPLYLPMLESWLASSYRGFVQVAVATVISQHCFIAFLPNIWHVQSSTYFLLDIKSTQFCLCVIFKCQCVMHNVQVRVNTSISSSCLYGENSKPSSDNFWSMYSIRPAIEHKSLLVLVSYTIVPINPVPSCLASAYCPQALWGHHSPPSIS